MIRYGVCPRQGNTERVYLTSQISNTSAPTVGMPEIQETLD